MREPRKGPASTERKTKESLGVVEETRRYRFLTYVMGGGVKVKDHEKFRDERTPIRAASIRGQLRFWWRACNPRQCDTLEKLRIAEAEVWGSAERPSAVSISVVAEAVEVKPIEVYEYAEKTKDDGSKRTVFQSRDNAKDLAYAAFALQPGEKLRRSKVLAGVLYDYGNSEFAIRFSYPKGVHADVEAALWAWETFGGLGARTRRGFGAVERIGAAASIAEVDKRLSALTWNPTIAGIPSLAKASFAVAKGPPVPAKMAWQRALRTLQQLRQGVGVGRNRGPGRSFWPEPDTIRECTGETLPRHANPVVNVKAFPRAHFGLPIIFHFKDGPRNPNDSNRDPAETELKPAGADRMASPLIVRPTRDGDGYRAAALKLNTTMPPGGVVLKTKASAIPVTTTLTAAEARSISPLAGHANPLDRFLEELKK